MIILEPGEMTGAVRRRMDATERGLRILNPMGKDHEDFQEQIAKAPRIRYAAMRAHQEMAALALSTGSTQVMAARYAGVAPRQIKKYMADPDFRARIEELRSVLASKMKGKIMRELNHRVTGERIKKMETLEMLRIFDRITAGGKGMAIRVDGDVNVSNNYENILATLFAADTGDDVADFPQYGDRSLPLPRTRPQVEG